MKRITPEEVVAAYKQTGLKPIRGKWYDGDGCACGISALFATKRALSYGHPEFWADGLYGCSYVRGFVNGFDGRDGACEDQEGYEDGKAAWQAIVDAGLAESKQ